MNFLLKSSISIFLLLLSISCCKKNIGSVKNNSIQSDSTIVIDYKLKEATVIDYSEVDGCKFILELINGDKLQPENLASEFQINNLKVLVKYHEENKMNSCMAGKTVILDFIKLKNE